MEILLSLTAFGQNVQHQSCIGLFIDLAIMTKKEMICGEFSGQTELIFTHIFHTLLSANCIAMCDHAQGSDPRSHRFCQ